LDFVRKHEVEKYFMGSGNRRIRFIGHGVGLELDEYPFLAKGQQMVLEEGMTLALEPKLIYPGIGVVGIENTHVVTKNGLNKWENLMKISYFWIIVSLDMMGCLKQPIIME
jgi:Xaa-Pro aminopeptidase